MQPTPKMYKRVAVAFVLDVPKQLRSEEIKDLVAARIMSFAPNYNPEEPKNDIKIYRDRIEVFMP